MHFFAGSALRGLPGFPCLLREIRSSIAFNFAWRRRSPSVLNVDRFPAGYNAIVLSFWLSGGRGSDLGLFHKAKLPRGIIGCIRVRDANHCHTDANHCHGQNIAGSWGWNVTDWVLKTCPRGKVSFRVVYVSAITLKINSINGVQPSFPPLTAIVWSYLGGPISRFSSAIFAQKNGP